MRNRTAPLGELRATMLPVRTVEAAGRQETAGAVQTAVTLERVLAIIGILALVGINVIGFFAALLLIVTSLLLFALRFDDSFRTLIRFSPLLILPVFAAASTLWSDAPSQSLKFGLELILTAVAAIVLCRNSPARTLILVMFAGMLAVCVVALPTIPDAIATGYPLRAFFGSKNELGMITQMLIALGLAIALDSQRRALLRWLGLVGVVIGAVLLYFSQSTTALVCTGITAVIFPVLVLFGRLGRPVRVGLVAVMFVAAGLVLPFVGTIAAGIEEFRGTVLNKDATLTGRTHLWEVAAQLAEERPYFGHGYGAFWRQGNLDAEALWRWGGVANRAGFNFHNALVEMHIDLGLVGVVLLIVVGAAVLLLGVVRQVWQPSVPMAFIVTLEAVTYIRSYSETGLFAPFSFLTVLWLGGAVYAVSEMGATVRARPNIAPFPGQSPRTGPVSGRVSGALEARRPGPSVRRL